MGGQRVSTAIKHRGNLILMFSPTHAERIVEPVTKKPFVGLLLGNLIGLLLVGALFAVSTSYLMEWFRGPTIVRDLNELRSLVEECERTGSMRYVRLEAQPLQSTDFEAIATSNGKQYSSNPYFLLSLSDIDILVMTVVGGEQEPIVGPLQVISGGVDQEVFEGLKAESNERGQRLRPVIINAAAAFSVPGYLLLGLGGPLFLLFVFNVGRAIARALGSSK